MKREPKHVIDDLGRQASDKAIDAVFTTLSLAGHPADKAFIATAAVIGLLGTAAAHYIEARRLRGLHEIGMEEAAVHVCAHVYRIVCKLKDENDGKGAGQA